MNPLNEYIAKARAAGFSDDAIRTELIKSGWTEADINSALSPQSPPAPAVPVPPENKSRSKTLLFAVVILLVVIGIGGASLYFLPRAVDNQPSRTSNELTDEISPPTNSTLYADPSHSFSFYYPNTWTLRSSSSGNFIKHDDQTDTLDITVKDFVPDGFVDYYEGIIKATGAPYSKDQITLGGVSVTKITFDDVTTFGVVYYFSKDMGSNRKIIAEASTKEPSKEWFGEVENALKTISFTTPVNGNPVQ